MGCVGWRPRRRRRRRRDLAAIRTGRRRKGQQVYERGPAREKMMPGMVAWAEVRSVGVVERIVILLERGGVDIFRLTNLGLEG
jgi:hypothetical protein